MQQQIMYIGAPEMVHGIREAAEYTECSAFKPMG